MTLSELIERVEKLEGPSREVDAQIERFVHVGGPFPLYTPACTASLDAAIALTERVLPGWSWRVATCCVSDDAWVIPDFNHPVHGERLMREFGQVEGDPSSYWQKITDVDLRPSGRPAIALCLSVLRALSAQERDDGR